MNVVLPDGSTAVIRQGGLLSYNGLEWKWARKVHLEGEAFFSVKRSTAPFSVLTPLGKVEVLGTSFTVSGYTGILDVACKTGRVAVSVGDRDAVIITPGEGISAKADGTTLYTRNPALIDAWVRGRYKFDNDPVQRVWDGIEEAFGYSVVAKITENLKYTGGFSKDDSLETVLDIVCRPLNLTYDIDRKARTIRLTEKSPTNAQ